MPDGVRRKEHVGFVLNNIDVKKLQDFILKHADVAQIDAESMQALKTRQLDLHELVLITLHCNEGLLLFKPTTNNHFEVMFTHLQEFIKNKPEEPVDDITRTEGEKNQDTHDIENLVEELQLDNEWLNTLQSTSSKTDASCNMDSDLELDILLGRCKNENI